MRFITVSEFFDENKDKLGLKVLAGKQFLTDKKINVADINRPGLALTGFFDYFPHERIQVFGKTESIFIKKLGDKTARRILDRLFEKNISCAVITRNIKPHPDFLKIASRHRTPVLSASSLTTAFIAKAAFYLQRKLASRQTMHGAFVHVYGLGILMLGKSGIGKSEVSLELIKRGHRLIADDLIEVIKVNDDVLLGKGVGVIQHHMEIRGIGIIDIKNLFGIGAIRDEHEVDLILSLEEWKKGKEYERLGIDEKFENLLGVKIPKIVLPVKPGRNLSVIIEAAVMTQMLKSGGYNPAKELNKKITQLMREGGKHV